MQSDGRQPNRSSRGTTGIGRPGIPRRIRQRHSAAVHALIESLLAALSGRRSACAEARSRTSVQLLTSVPRHSGSGHCRTRTRANYSIRFNPDRLFRPIPVNFTGSRSPTDQFTWAFADAAAKSAPVAVPAADHISCGRGGRPPASKNHRSAGCRCFPYQRRTPSNSTQERLQLGEVAGGRVLRRSYRGAKRTTPSGIGLSVQEEIRMP